MRRFIKRPGLRIVVIPPHGRVYDGDILEGDQYAIHSPHLLMELVETQPAPVEVTPPEVVAEPAVEVQSAPVAEPVAETAVEAAPSVEEVPAVEAPASAPEIEPVAEVVETAAVETAAVETVEAAPSEDASEDTSEDEGDESAVAESDDAEEPVVESAPVVAGLNAPKRRGRPKKNSRS